MSSVMGWRLSISPGAVCLLCVWLAVDPLGLLGRFLLAAALHESGHLLVLKLCRVPVYRLRITAFGCVLETGPMAYAAEARTALAGPAVNLLLLPLWHWDPAFALVSLALAAFNLLPVWPLDGGRWLRAVLGLHMSLEPAQRAETAVRTAALCLLWTAALYAAVVLQLGLWPVLLTAALTAKAEYEKLVAKKLA